MDYQSSTPSHSTVNQLNSQKPTLVIVDMLNDFIHGKLKCERAQRIIPNIKRLLDFAHDNQIPVFYCNDEHLPVDKYEMNLWGPHAMKGTQGAEVIKELEPAENDYVLKKRTYSAFDDTGLERALQGTYEGKGADTIILTGIHTNICARHTAYDAFIQGYRVIVPEDGVEAFSDEDHDTGLEYMKTIYGATISDVQDIINTKSQRQEKEQMPGT